MPLHNTNQHIKGELMQYTTANTNLFQAKVLEAMNSLTTNNELKY